MMENVNWSHCILIDLTWNLNFPDIFSKNLQISNSMKICQVGAELFHADRRTDGRTDMTKLIVVFRNFSNMPKNGPFPERMYHLL